MIPVLAAFPILALASAQVPQAVDSLRALALHGSDSALVDRVRRWPDAAGKLFYYELRAAAAGEAEASDSAAVSLASAERLACAWAVAWQDSFFVRQATRFRSLSPTNQQAWVAADSVRRAGDAAWQTGGATAALQAWRESLHRYEALADTAGIAAALTATGAGFLSAQQYDSAEAYLTPAQDHAERVGDYRMLGNVLSILGIVSWKRGDLERASELYTRAKPIRERTGDIVGLAVDQTNLGAVAASMGDLGRARLAWEEALAAARSLGEVEGVGIILGNLAAVAGEEGNYGQATARLREALSIWRERGNRMYEAQVLVNLGRVATRRGDFPAAVTTLSEAAGIMRRIGSGPDINEIDIRVELAQARGLMGDLRGARTELERAAALVRRGGAMEGGASLARLALAQGELAFMFNQYPEAQRQYVRAQHFARGEAANQIRLRAQVGLAAVLFSRENYDRARRVLDQVLRSGFRDVQNAAAVRVMLGDAAARGGDTTTARRAFGEALDALRTMGAAADEAEALRRLGDLEARAGRALVAESLYQAGLTRLGARPAPGVAWPLHAGLAGVLRSRGALTDAAAELRAAIAQIERVSGTLPLEEQRSAFQADKWDPYVQLALVERARGRTEAAFEASEQLRARQMLDLLARGRVAEGQALGRLAIREQDLRRRMAELTQQAEGAGGGAPGLRAAAPDEASAGAANEALTQAQDEYAELLIEMHEADPAYTALVKGEIAPAHAVRSALAPDEALLEYLVGDSTTLVFVVTQDSVAALDLHVSHNALMALVDFARSTLASPTEQAARPAWRPPLRRLYGYLIAPVEASGLLAGKRRLLIAPHAELHYLPFATLVRRGTPEQFLVERYVLEYVPSASVWLRLRERPEPARSGGVLAFAPRPAALPGSRAEVAAIQRTYGSRARTLVGRTATESTFRALAPEQEIVHLATHGVLNKHNPLFSFVQLGAGGGDDGRLEVHEVFGLTLNARLLVLSACQTGVGAGALSDVPPGDDWIGLVQGFLYAGAGNVLATLWPVSDLPTARLMEQFYEELATGQPEVEALARAQRAALRQRATAHPFFWAGFTLVRGR